MDKDIPSVFVGLDDHQDSVQVCVMDASGRVRVNRSCANDWRRLVEAVPKCRRVMAGIEACTGAAAMAEELVERAGWSVSLGHPGYVHRMKQSPDKSDYSDARMLADRVRVGYLPKVWLAPAKLRDLRELVRYRQQLVDEGRRIKQRIRAVLRNHRIRGPYALNAWTLKWLRWLQEEAELPEQSRWVVDQHLWALMDVRQRIEQAQQRLREATTGDEMVSKLLGEPKVGEVTAWVIRAEIGCFDRFATGKQLSRFCGLSPRNASSGERVADAGLIKAGSDMLRATLIQLAHRLCNGEGRYRQMKNRMKSAGKAGSVIAAAVANRWTRSLHGRMTCGRSAA